MHSKQQTESRTDKRHTQTHILKYSYTRQILCQTLSLSSTVRQHPNKFPLAVRLTISMTAPLPLLNPWGNCGKYINELRAHETLFIKIAVSVGGFRDKSRCFQLSTAARKSQLARFCLLMIPAPSAPTLHLGYWQRFVGLISRECDNLLPS